MKGVSAEDTSSLIDIDALTAPLDGHGGTGPDLRFDPAYRAIQEARREENGKLPQGVWTRDVKRANWPLVERLCIEFLRKRSKDLQIACWLTEAVAHQKSFAGVTSGLRLLTTLCRRFWPALHPAIEAADLGARLAPFDWLNTRLPAMLRDQPIVCSTTNVEETYTWTDYVNAQLLEGLRQRDAKSVERSEAAGAVTLAAFNTVRQRTDISFWGSVHASLQAATAALTELNDTLEAMCGSEAPGLGAINEVFSTVQNFTAVALAEPKPVSLLRRLTERLGSAAAPALAVKPLPDAVATREDAYEQLSEIAELLHRLEPHSPVPYLIRSAVVWGNMTFDEFVMTFSDAGLDIGKVFNVLGQVGMDRMTERAEEGN